MAMRLGRLLNTTPKSWLSMQQALDLWELETEGNYSGIKAVRAA